MTQKNTPWHLRKATPKEIRQWDNLIAHNDGGGNFLQDHTFAKIKQADGWHPLYFIYETSATSIAALALKRHIPFLGDLWYFPKGPRIPIQQFDAMYQSMLKYIADNDLGVFLVQIEPDWHKQAPLPNILDRKRIFLSRGIQPHTSTVIVPLTTSLESLVTTFSKRARYSIRRTQKEKVIVSSVAANEENFRLMYKLMQTVAGGRGVGGIRPYAYYRYFWQIYMSSGHGRLYFAFENDQPVVGAFVIMVDEKAYYKDGGSYPHRKSTGASYFLQWQILNDMKAIGIKSYDMVGTPPNSSRHDVNHPLHGVSFFKTAFQQEITDYYGVFDIVLSTPKYFIWKNYLYPFMARLYRVKNRYFY